MTKPLSEVVREKLAYDEMAINAEIDRLFTEGDVNAWSEFDWARYMARHAIKQNISLHETLLNCAEIVEHYHHKMEGGGNFTISGAVLANAVRDLKKACGVE